MTAITFVGSFATQGAGTTGNVVMSLSALRDTAGATVTLQEGDVIVVCLTTGSQADRAFTISAHDGVSVGDPYTELAELYSNGSTADTNLTVALRVLPASFTDASVHFAGTGNVQDGYAAQVFVFRGVDTTTPVDATTTTATGTGSTQADPPSITPVTAGAWVLGMGGGGLTGTATALTNPGSYSTTTNHFRASQGSDTNDCAGAFGLYLMGWTSGAVDPAAFTGGNTAAGYSWAAATVALRPAPSPPGRADETDTARQMLLQHMRAAEADTAFALTPVLIQRIGNNVVRRSILLTNGSSDANGDFTIDISSLGLQQNDVVVANIAQASLATNQGYSASGNNSGAYDELAEAYTTAVRDLNSMVYAQRQGATPDTSITVSGTFNVTGRYAAVIARYEFVNETTIQDVALTAASSTSSSNADLPSITPVTPGARVVGLPSATMNFDALWEGVPSLLENFVQVDDAAGSGVSARVGLGDVKWSAGAIDPSAATNSATTANDGYRANSIALQPSNPSTETDTAFALNRLETYTFTHSSETDTALACALFSGIPTGRADEADTALKAGGVGLQANRANETDTAFRVGMSLGVSRANENDTAFALLNLSIGRADELDQAFALSFPLTASASNETDSAFALTHILINPIGLAEETDEAFERNFNLGVSRSNETDTAFQLSYGIEGFVGRADEVDSVLALAQIQLRSVGFLQETETAFAPGLALTAQQANEADTSLALVSLSSLPTGRANEFDLALPMFGALEAGSGRKPHIRLDSILRDRIQPVHKVL